MRCAKHLLWGVKSSHASHDGECILLYLRFELYRRKRLGKEQRALLNQTRTVIAYAGELPEALREDPAAGGPGCGKAFCPCPEVPEANAGRLPTGQDGSGTGGHKAENLPDTPGCKVGTCYIARCTMLHVVQTQLPDLSPSTLITFPRLQAGFLMTDLRYGTY